MLNENPKAKLTAALINKAVKEVSGEAVQRNIDKTKKAVETTSLLSKQFKYAHQMMLDIITAEKDSGWATSKRKEAVKWLQALVKMAESDD
jgi:methionine synthase II (cobalamin-independent)